MIKKQPMRNGYHNLCRPEILNLVPTNATHILDVGCGTGELGKALKQRQNCRVDGIELNKEAAQAAGDRLDRIWCDNVNRFNPDFLNGEYDCIVLADILEHLVSPWDILKKYSDTLTDDGTIIASIPNIAHPWILSQLEKGLFRYDAAGILDITHLRFFTKTTIGQLFYKAGLKIVDMQPSPSATNPIQWLVTARKPKLEHPTQEVTIAILTWNGWAQTRQCIASIKARTSIPYKILVIDNGSTDETISELRADEEILHIENSHNLGFARGFNIGLHCIDTPYFAICNNDLVVTDGWLGAMKYHIEEDEKLVCVGPMSNHVSGPQLVQSCQYNDEASLAEFALRRTRAAQNPLLYFQRIVFFCTLFKTGVLTACGLLDERYEYGNFEDDDYCMRIAKAGLLSAIDTSVFIHHYQGTTFRENNLDYGRITEENKAKFLKKWGFTNIGQYFQLLEKSKG